jgi:hypothetical protein
MSMEFKKVYLLIPLCLLPAHPAMGAEEKAACIAPAAPAIIDGRVADKQKMLDMRKTVDTYMNDNRAYRDCLADERKTLENMKSSQALDLKAYIDEATTDSLDMDTLVIDTFNTQVRIYKSKEE